MAFQIKSIGCRSSCHNIWLNIALTETDGSKLPSGKRSVNSFMLSLAERNNGGTIWLLIMWSNVFHLLNDGGRCFTFYSTAFLRNVTLFNGYTMSLSIQ